MRAAKDLRSRAQRLAPRLRRIRRAIHTHPELGLETPCTQQLVVTELERIGVDAVRRGRRCSSVVAEIVGRGGAGPVVALRADMDALPLVEKTGVSYASKEPGRMHACGHDAHTAMLLGAAELLVDERERLPGCVRLLFQPGEEGFGGAVVMIEEGALDGVERAFALHIDPTRAPHRIAARGGAMLAAFDSFRIVFHGKGGHAATPYGARDPIPAIGTLIDGLSHVIARELDPNNRTVFSVTLVRAGTADNVIPADALCAGTIRTLSSGARRVARDKLRRVARGAAAAHGLRCELELSEGYPPTRNDPASLAVVRDAAKVIGLGWHEMKSPFMGAEDFSYVLERVPGAFVFLGAGANERAPLHSDRMEIDENVLPDGAALHAAVALRMLTANRGEHRGS